MIVLSVTSINNAPANGPSASFDELGGTIGRADNNQLVLPDPERTISRIHARVLFRNGAYAIVDNGSNPISVNGRVVGGGIEVPLKPGDQVQIGAYTLLASAGGSAKSADPFADLFGEGLALPATAPSPAVGAVPRPIPPAPPRAPAPAASASSAIPDDWDPFAPEPAQAPSAPLGSSAFDDLVQAAPTEDSLDDLFGLGAGIGNADPLAKAMPLPAGPPNMSAHNDPLLALGRAPAAPAATEGHRGSELNTPMPLVRPAPTPPSGAVFSWDEPVAAPPAPLRVERTVAMPRADAAPPPPAASAPRAAVSRPASSEADALRAALLEGLASPALRIGDLTPQAMRLIGQMLHESTRGTVELLLARAALKREIRAEVTMIVTRENNPLKFSPTVEVALQHLLGEPTPGFLPGPAAMRDAYDDLRAHQLGVMAGMRAALDGVLQRFDPAQLEANIAGRSSIGSLFAVGRKARLWELFQELFSQLQTEAQDNFDELFGKAFLQAYEQHIDRLRDESGSR